MNEKAQEIIDYIAREVIRRADIQITQDTPLVSSGLIDSLALVNILLKVEDVTICGFLPERFSQKTWTRLS